MLDCDIAIAVHGGALFEEAAGAGYIAPEDDVLVSVRKPLVGVVAGGEDGDDGCAYGGGKMHGARVVGNQ